MSMKLPIYFNVLHFIGDIFTKYLIIFIINKN